MTRAVSDFVSIPTSPPGFPQVLRAPRSHCQLWKDSYGTRPSNCSIWDTAFIINSTDWFLQKSFFNQEFPTPRMASTQLSYLRGYLGTYKCIKFQFHPSNYSNTLNLISYIIFLCDIDIVTWVSETIVITDWLDSFQIQHPPGKIPSKPKKKAAEQIILA